MRCFCMMQMYVRAAGALGEELGGHTRGATRDTTGRCCFKGTSPLGTDQTRKTDHPNDQMTKHKQITSRNYMRTKKIQIKANRDSIETKQQSKLKQISRLERARTKGSAEAMRKYGEVRAIYSQRGSPLPRIKTLMG